MNLIILNNFIQFMYISKFLLCHRQTTTTITKYRPDIQPVAWQLSCTIILHLHSLTLVLREKFISFTSAATTTTLPLRRYPWLCGIYTKDTTFIYFILLFLLTSLLIVHCLLFVGFICLTLFFFFFFFWL